MCKYVDLIPELNNMVQTMTAYKLMWYAGPTHCEGSFCRCYHGVNYMALSVAVANMKLEQT